MRKIYLVIKLLLLLSTAAQAQKVAAVPTIPADTVYFDHDWENTSHPEDRVYARIARHDTQGRTVGTVRDYFYPSWKKQFEGKLLQEKPDKASGLCTGWYENGKSHFKGTFLQGVQQADYREWGETGQEIKTTYAWHEVLSTDAVKLHSYYNSGSSRQVIPIDLPEGTVGVVYKVDIRDEDQPPVSWSTALTLAASIATAPTGAGPALLLSVGAKALSSESQSAPAVTTKCRFFLVDDEGLTVPFITYATKGTMPPATQCLQQAINRGQETRELVLPAGTRKLYFAVQNDNMRTSARMKLTISALQASRQ
ncbi:toxin-antitoxin system YwqK family antitoxin [Hymenobacter rubripertinctus]|uniref:Uncharacterized protein n=1 Tax=Hymenobacter rubripertinctus TaxID=2029981 RepID=A0A418QJ76_9BACT|nr:hypothetical protein [Hymenobacter rubripertinctus]RIY05225.1 hypothetical protein D0T11_20760 [Hymenobacter rubripertinctus]